MVWFAKWRAMRRARKADRELAWRGASDIGVDGLSNFERKAIAALEPITGSLTLSRANAKMPYLWGPVPKSNLVLYLYGDEAQVHGASTKYMRERWDYESPEASIRDLVKFIREHLPQD
jgi:hypothetical protein